MRRVRSTGEISRVAIRRATSLRLRKASGVGEAAAHALVDTMPAAAPARTARRDSPRRFSFDITPPDKTALRTPFSDREALASPAIHDSRRH
jgi:hypothetical protein